MSSKCWYSSERIIREQDEENNNDTGYNRFYAAAVLEWGGGGGGSAERVLGITPNATVEAKNICAQMNSAHLTWILDVKLEMSAVRRKPAQSTDV